MGLTFHRMLLLNAVVFCLPPRPFRFESRNALPRLDVSLTKYQQNTFTVVPSLDFRPLTFAISLLLLQARFHTVVGGISTAKLGGNFNHYQYSRKSPASGRGLNHNFPVTNNFRFSTKVIYLIVMI